MHTVNLYNGISMPAIGFGTYPLKGQVLSQCVSSAVNCGYRLFDTSDNYYNESDLGVALSKVYASTSVRREDIFLVTKLSDDLFPSEEGGLPMGRYFWNHSSYMKNTTVRDIIHEKLENSLRSLKTDYIDSLLLHWPYPDTYIEAWSEMISLYQSGVVKSIGVCNFRERHLDKLFAATNFTPMINQFETSPLNTKSKLLRCCQEQGIQIMTYSPLQSLSRKELTDTKIIKELCKKYDKSTAQIILNWNVRKGLVPIPKSQSCHRIQSNIDIFNVELSIDEIAALDSLNIDLQYLPESISCPGI